MDERASDWSEVGHRSVAPVLLWVRVYSYRGFHVGDARLGGIRIFDARVKIQHDAQWRFLTRASIF